MQSPYSVYNLRRNPFGELTRAERAEAAVIEDLDRWVQALRDPRTAIQFVGNCGFGKTTHLLALEQRLGSSRFVYYPESGPRPALPQERPVLVDEADRMGWRQHVRLLRGGGPIVIGTHVDYSWRLRLAGYQVLSVNLERPMEPRMVARILNRRIESSRLVEGEPVPQVELAFAELLLRRFNSNLRSIEHYLYERFQLSISEQTPWPPAV